MSDSEEEVREALEEVLAMYGIHLDIQPPSDEEAREERLGDYSEIISKTQQRLDDLNEKAEEIYKRTGMNREQLESYAANPHNFTPEEWQALQKVKAACQKYKRAAQSIIGDEQFKENLVKKRKKQPNRFAKKKHWIPL
ncbi:MAG: hypothetical protein R3E91_03385 [Chlamydiales bacterium]